MLLAHVNHGTRDSAWQDECVVLSIGARLGRAVRIAALAPGAADEAALRAARYDALERIAREAGATAIATAHTAEDQTETVLLALFRGTGPDGLGGMPRAARWRRHRSRAALLRVTHEQLRAELPARAALRARSTNAQTRYRLTRCANASTTCGPTSLTRHGGRTLCGIVRAERRQRARARNALRETARARALRDIPFERIEAALDAGPAGQVFLKRRVGRGRIVVSGVERVLFTRGRSRR